MSATGKSYRRPGTRFPDVPLFNGFEAPARIEADIFELEVNGELPVDLNGAFYRLAPDPQFPPRIDNDIVLNGDGMMSMFRFEEGHVDYKSRYVRTERFQMERAARRALFGAYRNPYTDEHSVRGISRGVANTTPIWHGGKLLALKEDSLPVELDPQTLETVGRIDYGGQFRSKTMTAHPKIDPATGDMYTFGYAARGETTRDVAFYIIDATGKVIREEWFEAPYAAEIHDFVVTQEHVIFPIFPTTTDLERIKAGGPHWQWDPKLPTYVGIFSLSGTVEDMKWYEAPACKGYHFFNAYTEGSQVIVDGTIADAELFPFFYADPDKNFDPVKAAPLVRRWTFDLESNSSEFKDEVLSDQYAEFPRVDERYMTRSYRYGYVIANDPSRDFTGGGIFGPAFNTITRYDFRSGQPSSYALDDKSVAQEPVFVPRYPDAPEGDGYLIALVARYDTMLNDLLVLDAMDLENGPIATVHLPIRLRLGVHVNWSPAHVLEQYGKF